MVVRQGAIVREPGQLWSIHQVGDCHSVGLTMMDTSHLHIVGKPGEALHDLMPGVAHDNVIVASHKNNI